MLGDIVDGGPDSSATTNRALVLKGNQSEMIAEANWRDLAIWGHERGATVAHGHSIIENGPVSRTNRIGSDAGAHRSGRVTALGIESAAERVASIRGTPTADIHVLPRHHPFPARPEDRSRNLGVHA